MRKFGIRGNQYLEGKGLVPLRIQIGLVLAASKSLKTNLNPGSGAFPQFLHIKSTVSSHDGNLLVISYFLSYPKTRMEIPYIVFHYGIRYKSRAAIWL